MSIKDAVNFLFIRYNESADIVIKEGKDPKKVAGSLHNRRNYKAIISDAEIISSIIYSGKELKEAMIDLQNNWDYKAAMKSSENFISIAYGEKKLKEISGFEIVRAESGEWE